MQNTSLLIYLWLSHFIADMMIGYFTLYKTVANLDLALCGLIAAVCPFFGESLQIFFGTLGDKGHRKLLLLTGLLATSFATLFPYSSGYLSCFALYLIISIGSGMYHPSSVAQVGSLTKTKKGLFITFFSSGGAVGLSISHLFFSFWTDDMKLNTLYLLAPILALITFLIFIPNEEFKRVSSNESEPYRIWDIKHLFRSKELRSLYFSQICIQSIYWGFVFFLPDILGEKGYPNSVCFGQGLMALILGAACMMIPAGYFSDRYHPQRVLLVSCLISSSLFYFILGSSSLPIPVLLIALFFLGASFGVSSPVAVAFGNMMFPSKPGLVSAVLMGLVWCLSEAVGTGGAGLLTKCFVNNSPSYAIGLIGSLFIIANYLIISLPKEVSDNTEVNYRRKPLEAN